MTSAEGEGSRRVRGRAAWARAIEKAWRDPDYRQRLLVSPTDVLRAEGFPLNPGQRVELHEAGEPVVHLVLPQPPRGPIGESALSSIDAGTSPTRVNSQITDTGVESIIGEPFHGQLGDP